MPRARSTFASFGVALATLACAWQARAQSCCAGAGAITPGRLSPHEVALVGLQTKSSVVFGDFDAHGSWERNAAGSGEIDLEEDLFGAVRLFKRGQLALLVPTVETWRTTRSTGADFGGGIGDINASARADFVLAGESRYVPGIALLAGATLPSGKPADSATNTLATDATGIGAFQGNFGLALEQTFGPWLVNLTGLVALRAPRTVGAIDAALSPQLTALAAFGYSFPNDAALALVISYTGEGDATLDGRTAPETSRRTLLVSVSSVLPITDTWRLQGSLFAHPPLEPFGRNQPTAAGLTLTVVKSWM